MDAKGAPGKTGRVISKSTAPKPRAATNAVAPKMGAKAKAKAKALPFVRNICWKRNDNAYRVMFWAGTKWRERSFAVGKYLDQGFTETAAAAAAKAAAEDFRSVIDRMVRSEASASGGKKA